MAITNETNTTDERQMPASEAAMVPALEHVKSQLAVWARKEFDAADYFDINDDLLPEEYFDDGFSEGWQAALRYVASSTAKP
jgi:hypothetical protein